MSGYADIKVFDKPEHGYPHYSLTNHGVLDSRRARIEKMKLS